MPCKTRLKLRRALIVLPTEINKCRWLCHDFPTYQRAQLSIRKGGHGFEKQGGILRTAQALRAGIHPGGVFCLISALAFHEITTQIPHEVHVAVPRGAEEPRLDHPPIKTYRLTGESFTEGVEVHKLDGVRVRIYSPEKTLADLFKFRNRIGLDTALEAIRFYARRKSVKVDDIM
jgi:hypothetical protein